MQNILHCKLSHTANLKMYNITNMKSYRGVFLLVTHEESAGCFIKFVMVRTNKQKNHKIYYYKTKSWFCLSPKAAPCIEVGTMPLKKNNFVNSRRIFTNFWEAATICYMKATPLLVSALFLLMINTLDVTICINYLEAYHL